MIAEHFSMTLLSVSPFLFTRIDSGWKFLFRFNSGSVKVEWNVYFGVWSYGIDFIFYFNLEQPFSFHLKRQSMTVQSSFKSPLTGFSASKTNYNPTERPRNIFPIFWQPEKLFLLTAFYFSSGQLEPFMVSEQFSHLEPHLNMHAFETFFFTQKEI